MGKQEEAYEYLKNAILTNELLPETAISELVISEKLSMSRTPIREALRKLESDGLIVSYPSRGSFVTSVNALDVEEIFSLRALFEKWAFERSIYHISDAELDELAEGFKIARERSDWDLVHKTDRKLHRLIIDRAGSKRLASFFDTLELQVERIRLMGAKDPGRSRRSYEEHTQIINCIREKDVKKGVKILEQHLRSVSESAIRAARMIQA